MDAALGSELARADKKARAAATAGFVRLVDILAGKAATTDARRRALVAAATMIGAVTMSRVVTDFMGPFTTGSYFHTTAMRSTSPMRILMR